MMSRRTLLNGTALGSALAALAPEVAVEARGVEALQTPSERALDNVTTAITVLRDDMRRQDSFWEINQVRDQIKTFLRVAGTFPDYIDDGVDTWHQVYDWHARYQQPLNIAKNTEGRYTILLASTLVIMRTELPLTYIGQGYDNR